METKSWLEEEKHCKLWTKWRRHVFFFFLDEISHFQQQPGLYLERREKINTNAKLTQGLKLFFKYFTFMKTHWVDHSVHVSHFDSADCRRPPAAGFCCRTGRIIQSDSRWEAASAEGGEVRHLTTLRRGGRKPTVSFSSHCPWSDWSGRLVRVSRCPEVTVHHAALDSESRLGTNSVQRENGNR